MASPLVPSTVGSSSALRAPLPPPPLVSACHFEAALERVGPSVSRKDVRQYDAIRLRLRSGKGRLTAAAATAVIAAGTGTSDPAAAAAAAVEGAMDRMPSPVIGLLGAAMMGDDDDVTHSSSPLLGGGIHGLGAGLAGGPHSHGMRPGLAPPPSP